DEPWRRFLLGLRDLSFLRHSTFVLCHLYRVHSGLNLSTDGCAACDRSGDVFGMLQGKLANLNGDFLDWKVFQQMSCELLRQCLDEIDRLSVNKPLCLLGYENIVNRLADFVRHIVRFPTWPKRNVDR